jgi:hypothetical protein
MEQPCSARAGATKQARRRCVAAMPPMRPRRGTQSAATMPAARSMDRSRPGLRILDRASRSSCPSDPGSSHACAHVGQSPFARWVPLTSAIRPGGSSMYAFGATKPPHRHRAVARWSPSAPSRRASSCMLRSQHAAAGDNSWNHRPRGTTAMASRFYRLGSLLRIVRGFSGFGTSAAIARLPKQVPGATRICRIVQ